MFFASPLKRINFNSPIYPFKGMVLIFISLLLPEFLLFQGCSGVTAPIPTVTVTTTVTATVTLTADKEGEATPSPADDEEKIHPPDEDYNLKGEFTDIKYHPDKKYIIELAKQGIITGYEDRTFRPDEPVKRSVYLLWLYNGSNRKTPLTSPPTPTFPDMSKDYWLYQVIEGMVSVGGFKGYPDKTFKPEGFLTREEWCVINCFLAADTQYVIDQTDSYPSYFKLSNYNDPMQVGKHNRIFVEYACSVQWCETAFGKPLKKIPFSPQKEVTRAQATKWIHKYKKNLEIY